MRKYFARTNNPAEIFNKRLNALIMINRPKFMVTLDALRIITIESKLAFEMRVSSPKKVSLTGSKHLELIGQVERIIDTFIEQVNISELLGDVLGIEDLEKINDGMDDNFLTENSELEE